MERIVMWKALYDRLWNQWWYLTRL